jgi:DNA (cytosine-5)-methyltransferase 1
MVNVQEIIVDSFAGGGGASTGIEMALGRSPDIAINHDAVALAMHEVNHPQTLHLTSDIWSVDPGEACGGRPVGLLWASPDCKHFSKAKGGKPVDKNIRGLAWVVVHWANVVQPRVIILENVEEFSTWGPLGADGKPCPKQKGQTFERWVSEMQGLGYVVEWRELRACDFGAPTIRKRLFLIARRDGAPIVWPEPTHGDPKSDAVRSGKLKPWRTAAEIIDWSLPCPSIFDTSAEIMAKYGLRAVRPLQEATMARIAKGVKRYVLDAAKPFIVNLTHQGGDRAESIDDPMATVTGAHRGEKALAVAQIQPTAGGRKGPVVTWDEMIQEINTPFVTAAQQGGSARDIREPLHTVTASAKDQNQIIVPTLIQTGYGERDGQEPRVPGLDKPLGTAVAGGIKHALVTPFVTKFNRGATGHPIDDPLHTITAAHSETHTGGSPPLGIVAPHLMTMRNAQKPFNEADKPAHTITSGGAHMHLVAAFMAQHNYLEAGHAVTEPVSTIVGKGSTQGLAAVNLLRQFGTGVGSSLDEPARTVMADGQGKTQLSAAFLQKYYGSDQDPQLQEPLHTVTTKDRFGLVTVNINGEPYVITDIGMRMLTPRELFRAQGFPDDYVIDRKPDGSPITKTDQVSKCGNSVCPPIACALVAANVPELAMRRAAA